MRHRLLSVLACLGLTSAPLFSYECEQFFLNAPEECGYDVCEEPVCVADECEDSWARIVVGGAYGKYIGLKDGYLEAGLIGGVSLNGYAQLLGDARAFFMSGHHWSGSLGLGYRYACENVCPGHYELLGVNVYYDGLEQKFTQDTCGVPFEIDHSSHRQRDFHRLGLGVEYLSSCLDVYANAYLPVGKHAYKGKWRCFSYPGDYEGCCRSRVFLPWGVDGEVGTNYRACNDYLNAYFGLGGYYYKHKYDTGITGFQARFELSWWDILSLQFLYSYDHHFASKYQGRIELSIPFEKLLSLFCWEDLACCYEFDPWQQKIRRNYVPFLDDSCCWRWNW